MPHRWHRDPPPWLQGTELGSGGRWP